LSELFLLWCNLFFPPILGFVAPVPTRFLEGNPEYNHISSSLIRDKITKNESIGDLVPPVVEKLVVTAYRDESKKTK